MRTNVIRKWSRPHYLRLPVSLYSTSIQQRQTIASKNPTINAFVHVSEPPSTVSQGLPLSGLTVAIKDNIATSSMPTTCSSAMLNDFVSPFDASVVEILQKSGADLIGKTNCDEFGMGSLNIHSIHGPVKNPIGMSGNCEMLEERSAGGSSGGSVAAVAAGMCDAALGTDTGGSVRLPASYCGVVGFKPSYGLISRWGVVAYADSLDCVGIFANDVPTVQRVFDQVAVYDPMDPTSTPEEVRKKSLIHTTERISSQETCTSILNGLKVGVPQEYFPSEMSPDIIEPIRKLIARLKSYGAIVIPVSLPTTSYALSSYYVLATAEASSNLARYDGVQYGSSLKRIDLVDLHQTAQAYGRVRTTYFGPEVKKRILLGSYALSTQACEYYFFQAQKVRQLIRNDFDNVFSIPNYFSHPRSTIKEGVDVLLHPSAIRTAPLLSPSDIEKEKSSLDSYVQDVLTVPASLAGLPALSIPVRTEEILSDAHQTRWPIGVSIVGQRGTDDLVLAVGNAVSACQ